MAYLRVERLEDFRGAGDTVVLLAFDAEGGRGFLAAVESALLRGEAELHAPYAATRHTLLVTEGKDSVTLVGIEARWEFSRLKLTEVAEKLHVLVDGRFPAHHYVDTQGEANTLVLSLDEYSRRYQA